MPLRIFAAAGHDTFRKPRTGMWARLASGPGQPAIDRAASFFVGDAAGRPADPSRRRGSDFSCVDRCVGVRVAPCSDSAP